MTELTPALPVELADRIAGPARYKYDQLVEGIRLEQQRLCTGSHLVVSWHRDLDYDGITEWLYLDNAFAHAADACRHAGQVLGDLSDAFTRLPPKGGESWRVDATREIARMPKIHVDGQVRVEDEKVLALDGGPFNRLSFRILVLGPFPGPVIGAALFECLGGLRHELWGFFVDVGEAREANRPRRTPIENSGR